MIDIDTFATDLFEEAKRFLEKAKETSDSEGQRAFLRAALLLGISSLEAHVNAIAHEMSERENLGVLERSILLEKEYSLKKGELKLTDKLKMHNLLDRIEFIVFRFARQKVNRNEDWWGKLQQGINERNAIVHPKNKQELTVKSVKLAFEGILGILDELYIALYKKPFPAKGRKFDSKMNF